MNAADFCDHWCGLTWKNRNIRKSIHGCHVIAVCDLFCGRCTDICQENLIRCSHIEHCVCTAPIAGATCASFSVDDQVPEALKLKLCDRCKPAPWTHFSELCLRLSRNDAPLRLTGLCLTALSYLITIIQYDMH